MLCSWGESEPYLKDYVFHVAGHGYRVDKRHLHAVLRKMYGLPETDDRWIQGMATAVRREGEHWRVEVDAPPLSLVCQHLALAMGRARIAGLDNARKYFDALFGHSFLLPEETPFPIHEDFAILDAVEAGWWFGMVMPETNLRSVTFFTDHDLVPRERGAKIAFLREQARGGSLVRQLGPNLEEAIAGMRFRVIDARTSLRLRPAYERCLAVGDAFMTFDPLAGCGVLEALKSGKAAAEVILAEGREYGRKLEAYVIERCERFNEILQGLHEAYLMEQRWPHHPFWRRRHRPEWKPVTLKAEARRGNLH